MNRFQPIGLGILTAFILVGCGGSVHPPGASLGTVHKEQTAEAGLGGVDSMQSPNSINAQAETAVADGALKAWRKALAGDEKGSLAILDDLDKNYPNLSTVKLMRGQCLDRLGKKKEAAKYYQQAVTQNEYLSINVYKLAEAKRTTGDARGSLPDYRRLIEMAPNWNPGRLGFAQALMAIDKSSPEAKAQLKTILKSEPSNKDAKALLLKMGGN